MRNCYERMIGWSKADYKNNSCKPGMAYNSFCKCVLHFQIVKDKQGEKIFHYKKADALGKFKEG